MVALYRKRDSLCGVIVDIGSGSVAASVILSNHKRPLPEVIYTHREFMPVKEASVPADSVRSMRQALFAVMHDLEQAGMAALRERGKRLRVDRILVSCTAPWSHTITQIIHFEQDTPFTVTPRMIDEILLHAYEKEQEVQTGEQKKALAEEGQHIVEKSVIDIALNGYPVSDPYNKEASEITIAHLRGLIPTSIFTTLEDIEKHMRSSIEVRMHTSAFILYCVLRDLYPEAKNSLIIDISGEATEITLIQNGILYESIAVAYGLHSLTRDIAGFCKTIPEEAHGYLEAYEQKALTKVQEKGLTKAQKGYESTLEIAIQDLASRYVIPRTVFLILDQNMEQCFIDTIQNAMRGASGQTDKTIIPLTPQSTREFVMAASESAIDPRLAMIARFFHKLHACGQLHNELDN